MSKKNFDYLIDKKKREEAEKAIAERSENGKS